ncbi:hypothetical protein ACFV4N_07725 [Actinosynnema sp. NPDC059797]
MPPSRRRPVPTPPTARPKVAGLRKRPGATPADPQPDPKPTDSRPAEAGTTALPAEAEAAPRAAEARAAEAQVTEATGAESAAGEGAPARSSEELGLIEPRDDTTETDTPTPDGDTAPAPDSSAPDGDTDGDTDGPAPSPRPWGRHRPAGEAVAPSVLDEPAAATPPTPPTPGPHHPGSGSSGLVLPVALLVLAALLVGLGVWFQRQAGDVRYDQALVDSAGTTEVAGQAREAVEKAFSYNFADVASTERAANELLVGKAQCQYNAIFGPVRTLAPEQKLVVTVKAVSSGVTSLAGDRATVLLFLDQVTTRTTDNQSGGGIAMMRVGTRKVDGRWKVDNMEMFGQSGDQAAETAKC